MSPFDVSNLHVREYLLHTLSLIADGVLGV